MEEEYGKYSSSGKKEKGRRSISRIGYQLGNPHEKDAMTKERRNMRRTSMIDKERKQRRGRRQQGVASRRLET